MLLCKLIAGATADDTPTTIAVVTNTNNNVQIANNKVLFKEAGWYEIIGVVTVTSTVAGEYGVCLNANGVPVSAQSVGLATGADETVTLPVYGVVDITNCPLNEIASVEVMPIGAPTIVDGNVSVKLLS